MLLPEFSHYKATDIGPHPRSIFATASSKPKPNMTSVLDVIDGLDIEPSSTELARRVSSSLGISTSPTGSHTPPWTMSGSHLTRVATGGLAKQLKPFATEDIKILLLENVNVTGRDLLERQGYQVTHLKAALPEDELIEKIRWGDA